MIFKLDVGIQVQLKLMTYILNNECVLYTFASKCTELEINWLTFFSDLSARWQYFTKLVLNHI